MKPLILILAIVFGILFASYVDRKERKKQGHSGRAGWVTIGVFVTTSLFWWFVGTMLSPFGIMAMLLVLLLYVLNLCFFGLTGVWQMIMTSQRQEDNSAPIVNGGE